MLNADASAGAVGGWELMDDNEIDGMVAALAAVRALPVDDPRRQRVQRAVDGLVRDAQRQRRADRRRRTADVDRAVVAATATGAKHRPDGLPADDTTGGVPGGTAGTARRGPT